VQVGLRAALEDAGMAVAAVCDDAATAEQAVLEVQPDVMLLSCALPGGAERAIVRVRAVLPRTAFVFVVDDADVDTATMLDLVGMGAHGILLGGIDPVRLPHALVGVLDGEAAFPRRLVRAMADELARRRRPVRADDGTPAALLSPREAEVLAALADGASARDVAARLGISPATVRRHVANAIQKLGATDRAAALARLRGEAPPPALTGADGD
jgi:DNA-binding NarL/FixJ family response regulator